MRWILWMAFSFPSSQEIIEISASFLSYHMCKLTNWVFSAWKYWNDWPLLCPLRVHIILHCSLSRVNLVSYCPGWTRHCPTPETTVVAIFQQVQAHGIWSFALVAALLILAQRFESCPSSRAVLLPPFVVQHCGAHSVSPPVLLLDLLWTTGTALFMSSSSRRKELLSSYLRFQKVVHLATIHYWTVLEKLCELVTPHNHRKNF